MIVPKHYLLCQWQIEQRRHSRLSFHWDVNQCLQSVMITGIWDSLCLTSVISNVQAKAVETQRPTLIKLFDVHNPSRLFAPCIDEFLPKNVLSFHALFYALDNLKAQVQKNMHPNKRKQPSLLRGKDRQSWKWNGLHPLFYLVHSPGICLHVLAFSVSAYFCNAHNDASRTI